MKITSVDLVISAVRRSQYPTDDLPEFMLVGRSNVGKSSFINALTCRKNLAYTSSKPGKTQTLNFYNINDMFYCVDLPGYGYAKTSEETRAKWGKMIEKYLNKSKQLKQVFLLIDIRHNPSANDRQMYEWIVYQGYTPIIIATKLDKINRSQIQKHVKMVKEGLGLPKDGVVIPFSSQTKQGLEQIWAVVDNLVIPPAT